MQQTCLEAQRCSHSADSSDGKEQGEFTVMHSVGERDEKVEVLSLIIWGGTRVGNVRVCMDGLFMQGPSRPSLM
jgi:hypothetical protein